MVALNWDLPGERFYEAGVDRGVFYPNVGSGVAWNGLISVDESVSGGEQQPIHFDGKKVFDLIQNEDFQADIEAYSAPAAFRASDGIVSIAPGLFVTQQPRITFGFSYRTKIGNDIKYDDYGYKIHLVYNATASPTTRSNKTQSSGTDITPLKWTINAVPPPSSTFKPASHLVIDSSLITSAKLTSLENLLYGTASTNPGLPTQSAVVALLSAP